MWNSAGNTVEASGGDPASIAKELWTHGAQAPEGPALRRYKTNDTISG